MKFVSSDKPRWFRTGNLLADMKTKDEMVNSMIYNEDGLAKNGVSLDAAIREIMYLYSTLLLPTMYCTNYKTPPTSTDSYFFLAKKK